MKAGPASSRTSSSKTSPFIRTKPPNPSAKPVQRLNFVRSDRLQAVVGGPDESGYYEPVAGRPRNNTRIRPRAAWAAHDGPSCVGVRVTAAMKLHVSMDLKAR